MRLRASSPFSADEKSSARRFLEPLRPDQVCAVRGNNVGQRIVTGRSDPFCERRSTCNCLIGAAANSALTFARPWLLLLLLAVPLLAYLRGKRGPAAALTFSSTASLRAIGKQSAARAGKILRSLLLASLAVFVIALARPQLGKSLTQIEASGIDIILVLDVSGSMLTKDFTIGGQEATRVDAIREVTRKFIEGRPNDRIGIIAFAGRPYVVSPMTLDHDWLLQNLDRVRIGLVEDGTAIGSAMAAAANRLNDKRSKSRVLVLLTDGENNAGKVPPNTAAEAVKALKIHLLCDRRRNQRHRPCADLHSPRADNRCSG